MNEQLVLATIRELLAESDVGYTSREHIAQTLGAGQQELAPLLDGLHLQGLINGARSLRNAVQLWA